MGFTVRAFEVAAGGRKGTAYELGDEAGTVRAEIWPRWGFNCLRWQVRLPGRLWGDLLYTSPEWESNPVPTRSGHPILFPFPGRMRDGRFTFEGKEYQLPLTDSSKRHAIHGFTPRNAWDEVLVEPGAVVGSFLFRDEVGRAVGQWPADYELRVEYNIRPDRLRVVATASGLEGRPLPFGLGYHPYFRLAGVADPDLSRYVLQADVSQVYEVDADNLPTGRKLDLPPHLDFRAPRPIGDAALDHVFTGVTSEVGADGLRELAVLSHPDSPGRLRILADPAFRELVLFTPPHRQAVAIEPYTCSADAANLAAQGVDSGWRTLPPGESWSAAVEYRYEV